MTGWLLFPRRWVRAGRRIVGVLGAGALSLGSILCFLSPAFAQVSFDAGGANGGAVRIGTSVTACASGVAGAVRYNAAARCLELCDGVNPWACISVGACSDATPEIFSFTDLHNQDVSALVVSNIVWIGGLGCAVNVNVSGEGSPRFRVCNDAACGVVAQDWTAVGTIGNGQYIQLRLTASAIGGDTHTATAFVGTAASAWNVTPTGDCGADPAPPVGTVCADGTVYAGPSPDGNVRMYVTRCDAGQNWNGTACAGARTPMPWNNGLENWVVTGFTSSVTGRYNTAGIAALDADNVTPDHQDHVAAAYCEGLSQHGHSDWYLPSEAEFSVINPNRAAIGAYGVPQWLSQERSANNAWVFNTWAFDRAKNQTAFVRCVRR